MSFFLAPQKSLSAKIVVAVTIAVLTVGSVFGCFHLVTEERQMLRQSVDAARLVSALITEGLKQEMLAGKAGCVKGLVATYAGTEGIDEVRIIDPNRRKTWVSSRGPLSGKRTGRTDVNAKLLGDQQELSVKAHVPNETRCHRCHGPFKKTLGIIEVRLSVKNVLRNLTETRRRIIGFTVLLSMAIASCIIALISLLINQPINRLVEGMNKVKRGDLQTKVTIPGEDELAQLGENFNSMVAQLSTAAEEHEKLRWWLERRVEKLTTLEQVATGIAHEVKSPLAGIKAAIEIIRDGFEKEDMRKDILEEVVLHIGKMDESVKSFLSFAKPTPPMIQPTDINAVVDSVWLLMDRQGAMSRAKILKECAQSLPVVNVDPDQMRQVLLNIGVNALEALDGVGGEVHFKTDLDEHGRNVVVEISDNGRGMSPEVLNQVFEPYFTTKSSGTGLGLAIAQRLVEENGGAIFVESQVGKETIFRIELLAIPDVSG